MGEVSRRWRDERGFFPKDSHPLPPPVVTVCAGSRLAATGGGSYFSKNRVFSGGSGLGCRLGRSWTRPTGAQDPNREVRRCRRRRRRELLREQILLPGEVSRQWRDGRGFGGRVDESCKKRGFALAKWEFCKLPSGSCRVRCTKCNLTRAHPPCPLPRTHSLEGGRPRWRGRGILFFIH